jgi:hypothetical protein
MFAKRLEIARRLIEKESYMSIQQALNVTSGTIGRVSDVLAETGDGFRKAHQKLKQVEEKHLAKQREATKNLANPFRGKMKNNQKTGFGTLLKVGAISLDKAISKKLKQRTAKKHLSA